MVRVLVGAKRRDRRDRPRPLVAQVRAHCGLGGQPSACVFQSEFSPLDETATPFIDLAGASGVLYRFRKAEGQLPPIGGNFVCVRHEDGGPRVVGCGKARTLARALAEEMRELGARGDLYIRLNVSAALRDFEHEDLVAALPQPFTVYPTD